LSQVSIARIDDRPGQMLRNRLLDKMNPHGVPVEPKYVLVVRLRESTERLALRRDATATRANLRISADYSLRRADGDSVLRGTSSFTGSYNVLLDDFATLSAENDARRRVTDELSEDIKNRVAIFLARPRQSNDSEPK
jgi:LPS-assembly lipoprotein